MQINREGKEIIFLIKNFFLLMNLVALSISIKVNCMGFILTKEIQAAGQRKALPFLVFMLLLIISWR